MKYTETPLEGVFVIEPKLFNDERGFFFESYNENVFSENVGNRINFVQDNHSKSTKGVLRGLHFQLEPYAQSKLIRTLKGEILDVAVDIRKGSRTYGEHFSIILSEENKRQLYIPKGFAHGFVVLSDIAEIAYKTDNFYHKDSESGIIFNDPELKIDWIIDDDKLILSSKDLNLKPLKKAENNFLFNA